jgi:endonuclease/exonuclease/phosphatase family metal-dependent hydrolase
VRLVLAASWIYLALIIATTLFMRFAGDRWWPATLLLFCRRSYSLWPLILLAPAALIVRRRAPLVVAAAAFIAVMFLMDLRLPWRRVFIHRHPQIRLRAVSFNVHDIDVPADVLARFVNQTNPDLLFIQDADPRALASALKSDGWNILYDGNSQFALASRFPIQTISSIQSPLWQFPVAATQYEVNTGRGKLQVFNVHLASPHDAFSAAAEGDGDAAARINGNTIIRLMQATQLSARAKNAAGPVLIAGDFDATTDGYIWRHAFSPFTDAFNTGGFGFGWTFDSGPSRARIDHILMGSGWECRTCSVGPKLGSSHRPLIADLQWTTPADAVVR